MRSEAPSVNRLFEIAEAQHGLFTTKQACRLATRKKPNTITLAPATGFGTTEAFTGWPGTRDLHGQI